MANNFTVRDLIADNIYISENNGNVVNTFGEQQISGIKNFTSLPTVNNTGVLLSGSSYITGISGGLQTQINSLVENSNTIIGLSIFL